MLMWQQRCVIIHYVHINMGAKNINMIKVFKYPLKYNNVVSSFGSGAEWNQQQVIELPAFSEVLRIDKQGDDLVLWARVNPDINLKHKVEIEIVGTGHDIKGVGKYVNTFFDGGL